MPAWRSSSSEPDPVEDFRPQRLLEAIFGDQAVRTLSVKARKMLMERADALFSAEQERYTQVLAEVVAFVRELAG